ncbi:hypothetical protein M1615_01430 [Patescibacteria group bacterium]|nr:hypothetical protein [Patescibacteria group bacterium]MCL5010250.1 hypothetical protein [Patescibacteria group bacterium]
MTDQSAEYRPFQLDATSATNRQTQAAQLRELILTTRKERAGDEPRIQLYRAITGAGKNVNGEWMFEGTDPERIRQYGIFETNLSFAQFSPYRINEIYGTRVPGLPVFATPQEVFYWLERKRFINKPTIAVLDLPISALSGTERQAILMRNRLTPNSDNPGWEVPYDQLVQRSMSEDAIKGECYLKGTNPSNPSVPKSIRQHEILIEPTSLTANGSIDFGMGMQLVQ